MYWYTLKIIQTCETWSHLRFCLKLNFGNLWKWIILDPTSSVPTRDKRLLWAGLALTCDPIYSALYSVWLCISMLHTLHSSKLYHHARVLSKTIWYNYIESPEPQHLPTLHHIASKYTVSPLHLFTCIWTLYNYIWLDCITLLDIWLHCITLHYFWLHQIAFCQAELGSPFRWQGPPPTGSIR